MNTILKYIHDNIRQPLFVTDVAERFGYSKWYFCSLFRNFTGRTFVEYVRHYRIQLAALDILAGKKVAEVAISYGYDTPCGFNKAFLKEYGCAPTEYRKQAIESQLYYERRRLSMFQLSDRCAILREEAVTKKENVKYFSLQADVYAILGRYEAKLQNLSNAERVANGMVRTIRSFTPFIAPGELIVGFNYGDGTDLPYLGNLVDNEEEAEKQAALNNISKEDMAVALDLMRRKEPVKDLRHDRNFSQQETDSLTEWAAIGRCQPANHSVIGYDKVLRQGFVGLLEEVEEWEKKNGTNPLYTSAKMICRAACDLGEKYAAKAEELLAHNDGAYNPKDLETIVSVCRRVPKYPASNFIEAVQSLWFAHLLNTWEDGINANSLGHLDQILYPYYKEDIEKGILTKEEAFEILCCLWIKLYRDYDVQQSCVGGTNPDGSSMVNELSYLMLDVTEQLNFIRCLSVRYSENTDKKFLQRALEVVGHVQKGVPFFFNDDVMIPSLVSKGIAYEDACNYTQIGCVETVIPGKSNPHAVSGETNLLKAIEYVLCNGNSMLYPEFATGVPTGKLENFKTYEEFYQAILTQIYKILDLSCSMIVKDCPPVTHNFPLTYKALLTEGCMASGRDFNDKGSIYDYYQVMLGGIPNLADSLMVIKKFVYQDQKYTLAKLKEILEGNFADEGIRAEFINKVPKFGNDIDEVDQIAVDILDKSCDMLDRLSEKYGISFHAQPFTFLWMIDHGQHSAASPDGRRKGEPIAYSCSSMQGRDFNGLTALLNSIAKLPSKKAPGTTSAIVEVDPKLFCDRNIGIMTDILVASSKKGLCNVQFNIIDADTLIDAQKHPERYNNLAVRVSGFSQKFNLLSPELQNHIIGRTKHTCL